MLQQLPNPWSEPESIVKPEVTERFISQSSTTSVVPSSLPISTDTPTNNPTNNPVFTKTLAHAGAASSGIEFGQLDEEPDTASVADLFPQSASLGQYQQNNPVVHDQPALVPESRMPIEPKKNLLDVFAGDFDEEFTIPVQSSGSYNAYSGAAYGNLNHDLSSFGTKQASINTPVRFEVDDTDLFLPVSQQQTNLVPPEVVEEIYPDFVSNISSEQAANLERQIEDEMRELVSGLNMNAMTFDPLQAIANPSSERERDFGISGATEQRLAHQAHTDVLSFSGLRERPQEDSEYGNSMYSKEEASFDRDTLSDDRDLLVIEDDLEAVRSGTHQATQTSSKAVLHPYAKLFTKLRSS